MDTQYTQGFKAGMAWREAEIIKLLEEHDAAIIRDNLIALIKGEK